MQNSKGSATTRGLCYARNILLLIEAPLHISYRYKLLIVALIAAGIMLFLIGYKGDSVLLMFLYAILCVPILSVLTLIVALLLRLSKIHFRWSHLLGAIALYWVVTYPLLMNMNALRPRLHWMMWSRSYKSQVLAQPQEFAGQLRFIAWDGWGFAGSGTDVFLVYDEHDILRHPEEARTLAKASRLPCPTDSAIRLARHWYSIACNLE